MAKCHAINFRHVLLMGVSLIAVSALFWLPAIPQDPSYHQFADRRSVFGVSYFFNVFSSVPFIAVGIAGLLELLNPGAPGIMKEMISAYRLFFAAIVGVGLGSGYYHLEPANDTLVWDRLPMSVAFMGFFTIILAEFVSIKLAGRLFVPLVLAGVYSVGYWYLTELQGQGDLRLYGLIQFLPLLLIAMILMLYPSRFTHGHYYWLILVLYALAKLFEEYDVEVYRILFGTSGHTLKHLLAALGCGVFLVQIKKRNFIGTGVSQE